MSLSPAPDSVLWRRCPRGRVSEQRLQQRRQGHAVVEPIGEGSEVVSGVLAEVERLVRAVDHGLQVAQDRVDPPELRQLAGLAVAHDHEGVRAVRVDDAGKAGQPVAEDIAAGQQVAPGPLGNGLAGERRDGRDLDPQRMTIGIARHCGDDGHPRVRHQPL